MLQSQVLENTCRAVSSWRFFFDIIIGRSSLEGGGAKEISAKNASAFYESVGGRSPRINGVKGAECCKAQAQGSSS